MRAPKLVEAERALAPLDRVAWAADAVEPPDDDAREEEAPPVVIVARALVTDAAGVPPMGAVDWPSI